MARANLTGEQLEAAAWKLAEDLKTNPISWNGSIALTYSTLRQFYADALYTPDKWPALATGLAFIAAGNQTQAPGSNGLPSAKDDDLFQTVATQSALYGIHCSDRTVRLNTLSDFLPVQSRLSKVSKVMDGVDTDISMTCAQWQSEAAGAYLGDFHVKTKNPILLATNKYDAHTPLRSARNVSSGFEGSGMLVVNGFGVSIFVCNENE